MSASNCQKFSEQLSLYLANDLPDAAREETRAHLESCAACREELIVEADRGLVRERRRGGREQRGTSECPERMAHCRNPLRGATAETTSAGASSDCHDPSRVIWPQSLRALPLKNQRPSPIRRNTAVICR